MMRQDSPFLRATWLFLGEIELSSQDLLLCFSLFLPQIASAKVIPGCYLFTRNPTLHKDLSRQANPTLRIPLTSTDFFVGGAPRKKAGDTKYSEIENQQLERNCAWGWERHRLPLLPARFQTEGEDFKGASPAGCPHLGQVLEERRQPWLQHQRGAFQGPRCKSQPGRNSESKYLWAMAQTCTWSSDVSGINHLNTPCLKTGKYDLNIIFNRKEMWLAGELKEATSVDLHGGKEEIW